jgi:hypothetical protein
VWSGATTTFYTYSEWAEEARQTKKERKKKEFYKRRFSVLGE